MEENPTWLNQSYLRSLLKASLEDTTHSNEDLTIEEFKAKSAVEKGKNYTSVIYKVEVRYKYNGDEVKKKSYIIKKVIPAVNEFLGDKETEIYKVLPKIEQFSNSKLAPKSYICKDESLVMEDLSEEGYQNTKLKLLDYAHCVLALKALAKFHAGSVLLHQNDPKLVEEKLGKEMFVNNSTLNCLDMQVSNIYKLVDEISTWPESKQYAKYIRIVANKIGTYIENLPKRNVFKVLNHGDFHLHNMMFKYDSDKVCEVRLVDFQICRFGPPTCDLQYFIASSADLDVRKNRLDELFTIYLNTFNDKLADLKISRRITKEEFEETLKEDYYMYIFGLVVVGIFLADPEDTFSLADEGGIEENLNKGIENIVKSKHSGNLFQQFWKTWTAEEYLKVSENKPRFGRLRLTEIFLW